MNRVGDCVDVVRIDDQRIEQFLRGTCKLGQDNGAWNDILHCPVFCRHEFLGNQIHAVDQRGHKATVRSGVQRSKLVARDGAVDVKNGRVVDCRKAPIDCADRSVDLLLDRLVLLDALPGRHRNEQKNGLGVVQLLLLLLVGRHGLGLVPQVREGCPKGEFDVLLLRLETFLELFRQLLQPNLPFRILLRDSAWCPDFLLLALKLALLLHIFSFLQILLDCRQLLWHALGIIQPLNGQNQTFALELVSVLLQVLPERVGLHVLLDLDTIGTDRENTEPGAAPQVLDHVHLGGEATEPDDTRAVVP
mmetsp:Transcript_93124/g.236867  ORF Transcript_93124/g.236867 Transcript_93124/m.236867 type:complete len:305 (-) Transcript_93124:184-1098(-)